MGFKKIIFQNMQMARETFPPPFMEKSILNFHSDYWNPSLTVLPCAFCLCCFRCVSQCSSTTALCHHQSLSNSINDRRDQSTSGFLLVRSADKSEKNSWNCQPLTFITSLEVCNVRSGVVTVKNQEKFCKIDLRIICSHRIVLDSMIGIAFTRTTDKVQLIEGNIVLHEGSD